MITSIELWKLKKDSTKDTVLTTLLSQLWDCFRIYAIIMYPILPTRAEQMLNLLNIPTNERNLEACLNFIPIEDQKIDFSNASIFLRIIRFNKI